MGTRRDDITSDQRAQIAITMLGSARSHGTASQLAGSYAVSRQTVYNIAAKGHEVLRQGLQPGPHGPHWEEKKITVDVNRLRRGSVVLTEVGVSQRDVGVCLAELLDTQPSLGWINGVLDEVETAAAAVNQNWQPQIGETLAGDELYANGQPNLLVVGNDSLYIYALSRQPDCDGETWGCTLLDGPACPQFASDAGTGLAAGAKAAEIKVHQLDWDHLLRPLWGQAVRLEKQAYAALEAVEERAQQFAAATTPKRLQQHLTKWEQLHQIAAEKVAQADAFAHIARQVDDWFALIDLSSGQLRQVSTGVKQLQSLGEQLQGWSGRIYHKLATNLQNWPPALFSYQPLLAEALQPLQTRYGEPVIAALSRLWQLESNQKRRPLSKLEQVSYQQLWQQCLDEAAAELGEPQLWSAWEQLRQLLGRSWRGSMLAECVNSLLRPVLNGRKHTDQGCLELFRFLHNVRPFERGKRADHSPAQLVGLDLPDDPLILLGLKPKVSI
ncbi:MAG TPA: hypothetical protein VEC96_10010 [Anaerolineae bacterium]|nr:hypothetical protein [Anaerolineae bacterium]HXV98930.1 hypothetical protein [Anaerolineae bacterium]